MCQNRTYILCTILGKINPGETKTFCYIRANLWVSGNTMSFWSGSKNFRKYQKMGLISVEVHLILRKVSGLLEIHHQMKQKNLRSKLCIITVSTMWPHSSSNFYFKHTYERRKKIREAIIENIKIIILRCNFLQLELETFNFESEYPMWTF